MDLSIIIVPYKVKDKLQVALDAVYASRTGYSHEVIIVDNGSHDGTVEMVEQDYPQAKLIKNTNEGFGKGNNRGIKVATGDYVLLLNGDTKVSPDTLQVMLDFMKGRPDVGISTCKLVKPDGELDWACRRSFPDPAVAFYRLSGLSKIFKKHKKIAAYNMTHKSVDEETEIDCCSGAFSLISRPCLDQIKGFDEDYFMYGEDIDLCYRAQAAGFKIWYYPKTTTIHYRGQSSRKTPQKSLYDFHDAMWIFYKKHLYRKYNPLFSALVYLGIWARYYQKLLFNAFRREKFVSR
jgi:GT2 family glycosyltransferase